jgi:CDP-diacylglycerol--glycerol-3-phosphate 3-phosphatidyltransferase
VSIASEDRSRSPATPQFVTVSNLLSILRALLSIPFAIVMLSGDPNAKLWGLVLLAIAALTDKLDGDLARKFNQVTEWGRILDPLADKIGMAVLALVLVRLGLIPFWFLAAILARDLIILAGGLYLKARRGHVEPSNVLGKWTVGVLAATMALALLNVEETTLTFAIWLSVLMLVLSFAGYVRVFVRVVRANPR